MDDCRAAEGCQKARGPWWSARPVMVRQPGFPPPSTPVGAAVRLDVGAVDGVRLRDPAYLGQGGQHGAPEAARDNLSNRL